MVTETKADVAAADRRAPAIDPPPGLQMLLDRARSAGPRDRITYRDPIARYGQAAMTAVTPWLSDRVLAAFAVRVIQRAGADGDGEAAIGILKRARAAVPPHVREDVEFALRQLQGLPPVSQGKAERPLARQHPPTAAAARRPHRGASPREVR
jgi:hypothetical protein